MSTRTLWQDIYAMEMDTGTDLITHVATNPSMDPAAKIGVLGTGSAEGKFSLPLTEHPSMNAPSGTLDTEQARGISERHNREFNTVQTGEPVEISVPMLGHAYNVSAMLALLLQSGVSEAKNIDTAGFTRLSAIPYQLADVSHLAHFVRALQPATGGKDIDLLVKGAICTELELSAEAGGLLNMTAMIRGSNWAEINLGTGGLGVTNNLLNGFDTIVPLKYQDSTIAIWDSAGSAWVEVFSPNISFTITNNALFNYYNSNTAASIHLGRIGISGSITIPYSQATVGENYMIHRFLEGEPVKLAWFWGQGGATKDIARDHKLNSADFSISPIDRYKNDSSATNPKNFFSIVTNQRVTDYEMVGENEIQVECTLEAVTDENTPAVEIFCLYDSALLARL